MNGNKNPDNKIIAGVITCMLLGLLFAGCSGAFSSENDSISDYTVSSLEDSSSFSISYESSSNSYYSGGSTSHSYSGGTSGKSSGNRSSYWYDDSATRRRKSNEIRDKYWDVDSNGQWHKKEDKW